MPVQSKTFLLKYSYTHEGETVSKEGVIIKHPGHDLIQFDGAVSAKSEPIAGDGFYGRSDGFHTVQYNLSGFTGTVIIQATLETNPSEEDWFTVYSQDYDLIIETAAEDKAQTITNFTGNYVYVRAVIDNWTAGTVNSIFLNH